MTVDLSTVPLVALSGKTKQVISTLLNPPKVIPSENGLPRDWRGLAHLSNLPGETMPSLISHSDPSAYILTIWEQRQKGTTVKDFQTIMEKIGRWDVLTDTEALCEADAEKYLAQLQNAQTSAEAIQHEIDEKVLTIDDLHRLRQGMESQCYDAFLLYADEDITFATEMMEKLEKQYNLKLCIKDRDLIGGVTFEHEAVMTLISERCNRLIVIMSSNFLKSPLNKFFLNYAQALGIDKRQRKVIPCLYEKCKLPPQLSYMFVLDYNRSGLYDFWGKLRDSVQVPRKSIQSEEQNALVSEKENERVNINTAGYDECTSKENKETNCFETSRVSDGQARSGGSWKTSAKVSTNSPDGLKAINTERDSTANNVNNPKDGHKKQNNFLKWTKRKLNRKSDAKKVNAPMTESVSIESLPELDGLDRLNTSMGSFEKKQKIKFIDKCARKVQIKKILVKS